MRGKDDWIDILIQNRYSESVLTNRVKPILIN